MAVDERARHALHQRLDEVLGPEFTGTLMELLPKVEWADVATKQDVDDLGRRMDTEIGGLRTETRELRSEMGELRTEVHHEIGELRTELRTGLAGVRADLHRELAANQRQLMFGLFGAIAANAGVVWAALAFAG